jgi:hypothetical protein
MILALWMSVADAAPPVVWPIDALPLKSGGWVQVDAPGDGVIPRISFVAPAGPDKVSGVSCAVTDGAAWGAWAEFFGAIQAEKFNQRPSQSCSARADR